MNSNGDGGLHCLAPVAITNWPVSFTSSYFFYAFTTFFFKQHSGLVYGLPFYSTFCESRAFSLPTADGFRLVSQGNVKLYPINFSPNSKTNKVAVQLMFLLLNLWFNKEPCSLF